MDIRVVRKDNLVSIAGNVFQCVDSASSDSVVATAVGGFVNIYDNINNRQITKNAAYESFKDERGNSLGVSATDVANTINSYIQSANPEQIIKATNKITDLARVEKFTTAKAGEFLAIGDTEDGAMVGSGYTADGFLKPNTDITVDAVTSYDGINVPYVINRPDSGKIYAQISIESGAAVRAGSFLAGDYIVLEGSTDDGFETILQVVDPTQDNTITFPNTSGTVALTSDIPSGEIAVDSVDFDLTSPPSLVNGRLAYDVDKDTLIFQSEHGEIAIGETYKPVYNATGSTISKGAVLKATGVQGERFTVGLFDASSGVDEELYLIGVAQSDIPDATEGVVVSQGYVKHLNTSSYSVGTILYASETPGAFTSTKPSSPNLGIPVAMVTKVDGTNGTIYVRLTQYSHLTEAHDVNISNPSNGEVLTYNSASGVWENAAVSVSVNGEPADATGDIAVDTTLIPEGDNLYYTEARVSANTNVAANTAKLAGIEAGAEVNVNADWNATSGDAQIFNKPTLAAVATSGAYGDLSGTPTIPTDLIGLGDTPATYGSAGQVLATNSATDGTEWITISGGGGAVESVNGQTGVVVLDTDDISQGTTNLYYTDVRVQTYLTSQKISASYPTADITGNALLTSANEQKMLVCKSVGGMTLAVPAGLGRDAEILVYQWGTGSVTIVPDTGVTIVTTSGFLPITAEQHAIIGLKHIGTTDVWVITGERKLA